MIVTRTSEGIVLGAPPADPARHAALEAAGAVLVWDPADADMLPHAIVWDAARAASWAWEIYGADVTDALLGAASGFSAAPGPSCAPARTAAMAAWARAWWPTSAPAAVPPLDPRVLALEHAAALADVEHVLDDPDAVETAVRDALALDLTALPDSARELADRVRELADDLGLETPAPVVRRAAYALAAAATGAGTTAPLATGTAPVDPSGVPRGAVDAAAPAHWGLTREGAQTILRVRIDRAPRHPADDREPPTLEADFAGTHLVLEPDDAVYRGSAAVAASLLLLPPDRRTLTITAPGFAARGDVDATVLLETARVRLDRGELLAEREAAGE